MTGAVDGRVAVVTGASRGVGRGIAVTLAAGGAAVAVNYRKDSDAADEVVRQIRAGGGRAHAFQASIDDRAAVDAMVDSIHGHFGPVSIVVSNAGTASKGAGVADTPLSQFESQLAVHALGPISLVQALLPDLRAGGRGDIVMISSNTVATTPAGAAPYTMAKAAMETAVMTLAREERRHGIRANIVAPGLVDTDMGRRLVRATTGDELGENSRDFPFGRVCTPEDIAGVVSWLVSDSASYVTGQKIAVDGGGPGVSIF
ncbi:SDR family oxidoreductase [Rhodococcus sp. IEGM 1354]|uniref:SDR family NAD(P)-dependent oxidoreductase n=1 Tax=Rhodococcus sp. IEGM 1354 TaxID=3047088 RepID=UPI0024B8410C|nr:SDR family oxidoreductase [Rhodococcus sp. IEGM 1354]MDI9933216.1 SDR family oxidoreductase [Rhodococcus sp. IEGM 1354]